MTATVTSGGAATAAVVDDLVGGSFIISARELCDFDDLATAAVVDPLLGFTTHKMNHRFRAPLKPQAKELCAAVQAFAKHQDYERAYADIAAVSWWTQATRNKDKGWMGALKEHVSQVNCALIGNQ